MTVNAISPGPIDTSHDDPAMTAHIQGQLDRSRSAASAPPTTPACAPCSENGGFVTARSSPPTAGRPRGRRGTRPLGTPAVWRGSCTRAARGTGCRRWNATTMPPYSHWLTVPMFCSGAYPANATIANATTARTVPNHWRKR